MTDDRFRDFVVDQLSRLDRMTFRLMLGGHTTAGRRPARATAVARGRGR